MTTHSMHADHSPSPTTHEAVEPPTHEPRSLTIREAAELCGLSRDAIRGRVERGSLRSVLGRDGLRRVPVSELERAGLLDHADDASVAGMDGYRDMAGSVAGFVDVFQRLHAENVAAIERAVAAETRLQLEQHAVSTVQQELFEARARVEQLEQQLADEPRRRWFGLRSRRS